jgi:hypothetical protein
MTGRFRRPAEHGEAGARRGLRLDGRRAGWSDAGPSRLKE